jgi:2-dehydropantoate 2-reductase
MKQSQGRLGLSLNGELGRRGYNGQAEERKVYKFPPGFDIVQTFPDRITAENIENSRHAISNPLPKKRKAEPWTLEDLELYRKHFDGEDLVMLDPDSNSNPTTPDHNGQKRRGSPTRSGNEKAAKTGALNKTRRQPPEMSLEESKTDLVEDSDGFAPLEVDAKNETILEAAGNVKSSVAAAAESRASDIEGKFGTPFRHRPNHASSNPSMENDKLDGPEEPQITPTTLVQSESNAGLDLIEDSLNDVHEETELSFLANIDPATLVQEQDEELERAMQHFNLGMWHKPWRPPRRMSQEEPNKEVEKDVSKQLELQQEQVQFNPTIHVLGMGTAGKYIAHSLAGLPHGPPVTLLMHRPLLMQQWHDEGAAIKVLINGEYHVQTGFHIESSSNRRRQDPHQRFPGFGPNLEHSAEPPNTVIETLIVTTDLNTTLSALSSIKYRLRKSTTICLLQDGLGIIEKINQYLFPDPHDRPTYVLGRMSHDLKSTDRHFTIVERQAGAISFAKLAQVVEPKDGYFSSTIKREDFRWSPQTRHMIHHLARAPELNAKSLGHKTFLVTQLEHLVVGAVIGPLSVTFDCFNDQLLYDYNVSQTMRSLLYEICQVILSFPELATYNGLEKRFNVDKLEAIIISCLKESGKNMSQMLQDVRAGRKTDVDFYTGYLCQRAKELGVKCPRNHVLLHLVQGRQAIKSREKNLYIPFRDEF